MWDDSWILGIKAIDEQHKNLVRAIGALEKASKTKNEEEFMNKLFRALSEYARKHFGYEERLLEKKGYPELDDQLQQHAAFIDKIETLEIEFKKYHNKSFVDLQLIDYLNKWIFHHIQIVDRQYVEFLKSKGVS